jgi:16S rRNA (cytidine1402-2'-O)-methyltransferase
MTYRAVEVLKGVAAVYCEDTRHSRILLEYYGIKKPLVSCQKFSERERTAGIVARLAAGEDLALISDAGMPLVSDPGGILVSEVVAAGLPYTVVSGPCAAVNAAVLSGFDLSGFLFAGFLPEKTVDRRRLARRYAALPCTLLFYISRHSLHKDLAFLHEELGPRRAALAREISKLHEEVVRFCLGEPPEGLTVRGEFVLAVEGAAAQTADFEGLTIEAHLAVYVSSGLEKTEAMKRVAQERGIPKSEVYRAVLANTSDKNRKTSKSDKK